MLTYYHTLNEIVGRSVAIIYSLWLYDQNFDTNISQEITYKWFDYMDKSMVHKKQNDCTAQRSRIPENTQNNPGDALCPI